VQATFALEVNEWGGIAEPRLVLRHAQAPAPVAVAPLTPWHAHEEEQEELVLFALP
jgi:hypothetical protein